MEKYQFRFKPTGEKSFNKLSKSVQDQIIKKLEYFLKADDPLGFAEYLTDRQVGEYRFRIGKYRIITEVTGKIIFILLAGHRRNIYKK